MQAILNAFDQQTGHRKQEQSNSTDYSFANTSTNSPSSVVQELTLDR